MAILRITKHGESVLKKPCEPVDYRAVKNDLPKLLKDMWSTMHSVRGVGLAAPQIGLNVRLSIIDVKPEGRSQRLVLINPEILAAHGSLNDEEGCLSVPGVYARLARAAKIRIRATDAHGQIYEMTGEGLLARAFQHEIDHLDGKLFIDRLDFVAKLRVLGLVRQLKLSWS